MTFTGKQSHQITHRVLGEAAALPLNPLQALAFKHAEGLATEAQGVALASQARRLHRYPTQATPGTAADSPAQLQALRCSALAGVFVADALDGVGTDVLEVFAGSRGQVTQVKARQPFALAIRAGRGSSRTLVTKVEHLIHLHRRVIQPPIGFRLHFQPQRAAHAPRLSGRSELRALVRSDDGGDGIHQRSFS